MPNYLLKSFDGFASVASINLELQFDPHDFRRATDQ